MFFCPECGTMIGQMSSSIANISGKTTAQGRTKRIVCRSCRDNELAHWWNLHWQGGPVVELAFDDASSFDKVHQQMFKRAIAMAAGITGAGQEQDHVDNEVGDAVHILNIKHEQLASILVHFNVDGQDEQEVQAIRKRLTFDNMAQCLSEVGFQAIRPRKQPRKDSSAFPAALKKGVKDACKLDPEGFRDDIYRDFVTICKDFASKKYPRKETMTAFKKLLLSTPLAKDPKLVVIRELVGLFRAWTKDFFPKPSSRDAKATRPDSLVPKKRHDVLCVKGQMTCFSCVVGQAHCVCCTSMRQLSLLRSLEHNCEREDGCLCHEETRREAAVRVMEKERLVEQYRVDESAADEILAKLEADFGALYPLSDSSGLGKLVVHTRCSNGHADWVRAIAIHPREEDLLVSASDDGSIKLWSITANRCLSSIAHRGGVKSLAWSPCGCVLISGSGDGTSRVWLFAARAALEARMRVGDAGGAWALRDTLRDHCAEVSSVAFAGCRACEERGEGGGEVCMAPERCGRLMASGSRDHCIIVYRYTHVEFEGFAAERRALLAEEERAREFVRECREKHARAERERHKARSELIQAEDMFEMALALKQEIGEGEESLGTHKYAIAAAEAMLAEAQEQESAASEAISAALVELRAKEIAKDEPTGSVLYVRLREHTDFVTSVAFAPNLRWLASASCDRSVRVWDLAAVEQAGSDCGAEATRVFRGHLERVWAVAFSRRSNMLASCSEDKTVRVWDLAFEDGVDKATLRHTGTAGCICDVKVQAGRGQDGGGGGDVDGGGGGAKEAQSVDALCTGAALVGLSSQARSVTWSPDDTMLLVSSDKLIKVFSVETGDELRHPLAAVATPANASPGKSASRSAGISPGKELYLGHLSDPAQAQVSSGAEDAAVQSAGEHVGAGEHVLGATPVAGAVQGAKEVAVTPQALLDTKAFVAEDCDAACIRCKHNKSAMLAVEAAGRHADLHRHHGLVLQAVFHPRHQDIILSCAEDKSIKVWTLARRMGKSEASAVPTSLCERLVRRLDPCAKRLQASARRSLSRLDYAKLQAAFLLEAYARRALLRHRDEQEARTRAEQEADAQAGLVDKVAGGED